ncbi:hypothetical protein V8C86DRAFT_3028815, partial [Haematococcus lacustris]
MSEAPHHAKRRMASGLRGTSLPLPRLPSGLGGSSLKKHKTQHKTKSAWVMEQLTAVTAPTSDPDETDGAVNFVLRYMCNHCQDNLAGSNKDRLRRHLLRCSRFLANTQAGKTAKTFSDHPEQQVDSSRRKWCRGGQRTLCQKPGEADCRLQPPLQHRGQPNVQDFLGYLGACNACPLPSSVVRPSPTVPSHHHLLPPIQPHPPHHLPSPSQPRPTPLPPAPPRP